MKPTLNEKLIAYLTLLSGLSVSAVAVYYSVAGLTAIFAAAVIPIIIMGVTLEIGKLVATLWLKQNWRIAPIFVRAYLIIAITVLMAVTSMGIFGFLSKAHMDQSIPSSDVTAQVAILDEKIKTERENIDANRKTLAQLDASVDQVLARSTTEEGATKSAQLRKTQQKERSQLSADNERSQKAISILQAERAPVASNLRKVEAEVGPIKYIAAFFYGETNPTILEKAVTWVIILLIIVFDPLAVILLLASQYSFQSFRSREAELDIIPVEEIIPIEEVLPQVIPPAEVVVDEPVINEVIEPIEDILDEPFVPVFDELKPSAYEPVTDKLLNITEEQPLTGLRDPEVTQAAIHAVADEYFAPADVEDEVFKEIQQDAQSDVKYYDWSKVPQEQEYVTIDGQKMHIRAAKTLYKQTPSVYLDIMSK